MEKATKAQNNSVLAMQCRQRYMLCIQRKVGRRWLVSSQSHNFLQSVNYMVTIFLQRPMRIREVVTVAVDLSAATTAERVTGLSRWYRSQCRLGAGVLVKKL